MRITSIMQSSQPLPTWAVHDSDEAYEWRHISGRIFRGDWCLNTWDDFHSEASSFSLAGDQTVEAFPLGIETIEGAHEFRILIDSSDSMITPEDARRFAAWLVATADHVDGLAT